MKLTEGTPKNFNFNNEVTNPIFYLSTFFAPKPPVGNGYIYDKETSQTLKLLQASMRLLSFPAVSHMRLVVSSIHLSNAFTFTNVFSTNTLYHRECFAIECIKYHISELRKGEVVKLSSCEI